MIIYPFPRAPPMLIPTPSPPPIIAYVDIKKVDMGQAKETVDRAWGYVFPAILTYASAAISFKVLIWMIKAGKGD
jgi:hypothetical protein